jgi:hypothetical protein
LKILAAVCLYYPVLVILAQGKGDGMTSASYGPKILQSRRMKSSGIVTKIENEDRDNNAMNRSNGAAKLRGNKKKSESYCTCFDVTQLDTAIRAIQNNDAQTFYLSCDPESHYKSITYLLNDQDPNFPYRYGVSGASESMKAECFVSDMHFEIDDTVYNACKSIMDDACNALASV